ncbi:NAD(P)-binding protein [Microthyrium microscopicum]|uniref:NAD(P)-binding protein n=1 Tax=Microthyrium microscopicum TaxID=703497 RepID=A0A6A6U053_9PEZI|nr:NAD(P)-binding protein [Microthyrium microscopicum]
MPAAPSSTLTPSGVGPTPPSHAPRILFIGAGSQGHAYAAPITRNGLGTIVGICEPIPYKRQEFGGRYIWGKRPPLAHEQFLLWEDFINYELSRREAVKAGDIGEDDAQYKGVDAAFICVLDELHIKVVKALAPLGLHIMCEKPLATNLQDCVSIMSSVKREWQVLGRKTIFGIGHVLRYSPQNMMLRKLIREDKVIGDVVSLEHTEPVGWWHMAHSFVRGNWRRDDTTAPILLTKCCHDIDFLMWLLCSPASSTSADPPHVPSYIFSSGNLTHFRKARKPLGAGSATNCMSCPIQEKCAYSAKNIYVNKHFRKRDFDWPLKIVVPEIEDLYEEQGKEKAEQRILEVLAEDYTAETPESVVKSRPWFGRCVWECDNNVCDDQTVTLTWEDDPLSTTPAIDGEIVQLGDRAAKTAIFHMTAPTEKICERRGRIYGTEGELTYDEDYVSVYDFATDKSTRYRAKAGQGHGHGGGDDALAEHFCRAAQAVLSGEMEVELAQKTWLGCDLEEVVRSHVAVFFGEIARTGRTVVDWRKMWADMVEKPLA